MGFPYRCKRCETRHTFKRVVDDYIRVKKCRSCGHTEFRLDKWMLKRNTRKMGCNCAGYHFFHRQGSKYCWYRTDGTGRYPGDADFFDQRGEVTIIVLEEDPDADIPLDFNELTQNERFQDSSCSSECPF